MSEYIVDIKLLSANDFGVKVANKDVEQKIDKNYPELEGIKYCDSCDMYLDNITEYNKHIETLKHRNNVRLNNGEIIKNGSKIECVTSKTTLSQYSVDNHLKTKIHLDNVEGKDKDNKSKDNGETWSTTHNISEDSTGYCDICNTRYNNKTKHNESDEHKENVKQKKLADGMWREKVNELGLDHNMKY